MSANKVLNLPPEGERILNGFRKYLKDFEPQLEREQGILALIKDSSASVSVCLVLSLRRCAFRLSRLVPDRATLRI